MWAPPLSGPLAGDACHSIPVSRLRRHPYAFRECKARATGAISMPRHRARRLRAMELATCVGSLIQASKWGNGPMNFQQWIRKACELGASDLHAEANRPLMARVRGKLQPLGEISAAADLQRTAEQVLGADGWAGFLSRGSADVSIEVAGTRCRINFFRSIHGIAFAVRLLSASIRGFKSCNLHPDLRRLVEPA